MFLSQCCNRLNAEKCSIVTWLIIFNRNCLSLKRDESNVQPKLITI